MLGVPLDTDSKTLSVDLYCLDIPISGFGRNNHRTPEINNIF